MDVVYHKFWILHFIVKPKVNVCQEWSIQPWHHYISECQHSAWHFCFWGIISEISVLTFSNYGSRKNTLDIIWLDFTACLQLIWKPELFDLIQMVFSISKLLCLWHIIMIRHVFYTFNIIKNETILSIEEYWRWINYSLFKQIILKLVTEIDQLFWKG